DSNMTKTLTRVYSDYASAELTVRELKAAGLGDSHIGIVASNAEGWHKPGGGDIDPKHDKDRDGKDDRSEGAVTGGGMGAIAGGAAGGIIGALVESGTSKENAELYAEALRRGGAIVTAKVSDSDETKYAAIMNKSAFDIAARETAYRSSGWKGYDSTAPAYDRDQVRKERELIASRH